MTTASQATVIIATRVARATGVPYALESAGGGCIVAVFVIPTGCAIVVTGEGVATYASASAWSDGADEIDADTGTPWEIVLTATRWITGERN